MGISRRDFLRGSAATAGAMAVTGLLAKQPAVAEMQTRPFGKTGWKASIYAVGTAEIPDTDPAVAALRMLMDAGVNYIDTAPSYRATRSETTVGKAVAGRRNDVWIASKTLERTADGAFREVNESLSRLNSGHIDLLQVHAVNDDATLDAVLKKGGAVEGLERARSEGLIRCIGITGHTRPEVILRAIKTYPFVSVLVPVSALDKHIHDFADEVLPYAKEHGIAVAGMKSLKGMERTTGGEFDPTDFLRYSLSLPVSTLTVGLRRVREAEENLRTMLAFKPMAAAEMAALEASVKDRTTTQALWWKRR